MNDVVIATHADGVARFYYRTTDGAMAQTGQLVAPTVEPTLLASLAADLTDALGWDAVTKPTKPPKAVKAPAREIAKSKTKPKTKPHSYRNNPRATRDEINRRRQLVLDHVTEHGPLPVSAMFKALFADLDPGRGEMVTRQSLARLINEGRVERITMPPGTADQYRIVPSEPEVAEPVQPGIV